MKTTSASILWLDIESMCDHWTGPWRLNERVWHGGCGSESSHCNSALRTRPPLDALIAHRIDSALLSGLTVSYYFAHHGGTQWPGYHVFEQVLQQLVLFVQLRAREEDIHQDQAQLVGGLSEEEFGDPQWPVWHQRAPDRVGADAGHCPPWPLCYGGEPIVVHHMPYDHGWCGTSGSGTGRASSRRRKTCTPRPAG